ncbi:hypothetical protein GCM10025875_20990 [Litorihabitans aurantiacus]|uniref:Uncharacterized protein n=1 Tax=Litorihabitans aurantiacus TaxID=1930061 RepID=A0AA37XFK3_9MICO|nr:hypothetical protein GCM10025875_20990 [Litorihabitans aurantiacus]
MAAETFGLALNACETADGETPASRATSAIVGRRVGVVVRTAGLAPNPAPAVAPLMLTPSGPRGRGGRIPALRSSIYGVDGAM